jgi:hypothetical protein
VAALARRPQAARPQGLAGVPDAKRLLGALANSRGHRHEENAAKLVNAALEMPKEVGAALSPRPRATPARHAAARGGERLGGIQEVAGWIADNPRSRRRPTRARKRRRRKKKPRLRRAGKVAATTEAAPADGTERPATAPKNAVALSETCRAAAGRRRGEAQGEPRLLRKMRRSKLLAPCNDDRQDVSVTRVRSAPHRPDAGIATALSVRTAGAADPARGRVGTEAVRSSPVLSFTAFTLFASWLLGKLGRQGPAGTSRSCSCS